MIGFVVALDRLKAPVWVTIRNEEIVLSSSLSLLGEAAFTWIEREVEGASQRDRNCDSGIFRNE